MIQRAPVNRLVLAVVLSLALIPAASGPWSLAASPVPGQTATLLPDGRWLILGGESRRAPIGTAVIHDPSDGTITSLPPLRHPRAWHTATVLPDGTVLILGGLGSSGAATNVAELFDPATGSFTALPVPAVTSRSHHTATLLTDGRLLIAGGQSETGETLAHAELWNTQTQATEAVPAPLTTPRHSHTATLRADGTVLLGGGRDRTQAPLSEGELFDPARASFVTLDAPGPDSHAADPARVMASLPDAGTVDVPADVVIALRFSKPVRVETFNPRTVTLAGATGLLPAKVVTAEGGALAFITPEAPLQPGATYAVTLNGPEDGEGFPLPFTTIAFTTAPSGAPRGSSEPPPSGGHGPHGLRPAPGSPAELDEWDWTGEQRNGKPYSRWQSLPPRRARRGGTALAGQVLRLNGQPLANVTLQIGERTARTDRTGRFLLTGIPAGPQLLIMDGSTASRPGRSYATFEYGLTLAPKQTTILPFTIWLPLLDTQHATAIPVPTPSEVVATSPKLPGLEVRIPANVILRTAGGPLTSMPLTRIPVDRPPFPLPEGASFSFTPQAHGAVVQHPDGTRSEAGVRVILPNPDGLPPATRVELRSYEPTRGGWATYGEGTVSADGTQIVPDPGVEFHRVTCYYVLQPPTAVPALTPPLNGARDGDPVDLATGLFILDKTDLVVDDVLPIVLRRTYRPAWGRSGHFGISATVNYHFLLAGDATTWSYIDLLPSDGARVRFTRVSPGTTRDGAVLEHTTTPSAYHKARLAWNATRQGWDLTFREGTIWRFSGLGKVGPMLEAIEDRWGNRLTITVADFKITRITSPNGRWVEFIFSPGTGLVTQARDNLGRTVSYSYDIYGRLERVTDAAGGITEYTYDPSSRMLTLKDARGLVFLSNEYGTASGLADRVVRQTQADGTTFLFAYTLDPYGTLLQTDVTDPRGFVRRVTFNSSGYPLTDTRAHGTPLAQTLTYERQAETNLVTAMTDALGRRNEYTYDAMGNGLTVTRLAGTANAVSTSFTYEATFNQVASVTDPLGHTTSFGYDGVGNLITVTNPLSQVTTLTYNASGQPLSATTPAGTTQLGYDEGLLASTTDPTGKTTTRFSDAAGRLISVRTPLGQPMRYDYDALNQLTTVTDPLGGQTQLTYDPNGNLLSLTDARNNVTRYAYNSMDRAITRTDPLLRSERYAYDNTGNPTQLTDRKSQVTATTYDALNRPTQVTYQDASTTAYTWDAGNRLTQVTDSISGTITRSYDGLDRLTQETTPQGTVTSTYDAASRRTSMTVLGQPTVSYSYDNADRLTQITQGTQTVTFAYDSAGRRTSLTLPNGVVTEYAYDAASRLTGLTYKNGPTVLGTLTYAYDAAGNRMQVGGPWARTGIPQAVASATYNAANQQLTFAGQTLTYDLNGNLTSDGATTYTWDARNRLAALTGPGTTASFQYDPLGRRTRKTLNGSATSFHYDRHTPVQELNGAAVLANLLTGLGIDEYFTRTDAGGTRALLTDALGSTVALTDEARNIPAEHTYEPFGATTTTDVTGNSFQYTGRENDGPGLYYYRARYYAPARQRFISEDPVEFDGGDVNLYVYVGNDPIDGTDPLGLFGIEDLPTIPAPVVNAVAGFGDAFLIPILVRSALDIDDVVDRCSAAYRRGMVGGIVVGSVPFVLRGAAALGGTRVGHFLNHNRVARIGPGRWPAGRGLPGGTDVPRLVIGPEKAPLPNLRHFDLRSRIPYLPPLGGLLGGRKDRCG